MTRATEKQISYLLTLVARATGEKMRFLSDARKHLGLSSFQVQKLTKADASQFIDEWLAKAEEA